MNKVRLFDLPHHRPLAVYAHPMHTASPVARQEPAYSRWWLALTILLGQVTLAFGMFATVVAFPKIMSAMSADVTSIHTRAGNLPGGEGCRRQ